MKYGFTTKDEIDLSTIEMLGLNIRIANALINNNIYYIQQLLYTNPNYLLSLRGIWNSSLNEIKLQLLNRNYNVEKYPIGGNISKKEIYQFVERRNSY